MRFAAIAALVTAVVFVTLVATALFDYRGELPIVLVLALLMVGSGWLALTRVGVRRSLAVAALVIAAWLLILELGVDGLVVFAFLSGVLALFGVAARYALTHARQPAQLRRVRVGAAARGVLIINPNAGDGKAERVALSHAARSRGVEYILLEPGADLRELAERVIERGADVLGMAGGDGSQSLVASVAMEHDIAHVCIPTGTRNHFALDLGLDREDVVGALDAFTDGVERRIDLARVNDRVFVNNASLGIYATVVQSDCYRNAKLGTWRRLLPEMLGPEASPIDLQITGPRGSEWGGAALVLVSNNPYQVRRVAGRGTRSCLDSGRLGILAARIQGAGTFTRLIALASVGQSQRFGDLVEWSRSEFEVRSDGPVAAALDGEACILEPPLRFASLPGALRVRLPRHAAGISPAARAVALTSDNLGALIRVAVGRQRALGSK